MMFYLILIVIALCTLLPLLHMCNALPFLSKRKVPLNKLNCKDKGISILIPCYNEERILDLTIRGMNRLEYQNKEVIYINDGSIDQTMYTLHTLLDLKPLKMNYSSTLDHMPIRFIYQSSLFPNVYVIDKLNGGKADSLNAGIDFASKELIITLDADSILADNSLEIINQAFQDPNVVAAGGMVHILQGRNEKFSLSFKQKHIIRFQIFEYFKGFYIYKSSLAKLNALAIISGAFGVFDKKTLLTIGGYRKTLGEDIDITLRFQYYIQKHRDKKVLFIPEAVCYTECPEKWTDLFKQRIRWQKAFVDCVFRFAGSLVRSVFTKQLSFFFLIEAFVVGTLATYFTVVSLTLLCIVNEENTIHLLWSYILISTLLNGIYSLTAVYIARYHGQKFTHYDKLRLVNTIILDLAIFRFITFLFIMLGTILYFFNKHDWNKVTRTGRVYQIEKVS
ncbi:glycosyltransferase family 2 protein [Fictibacillus sp. BK138]|uniref:glycosyltransferase family 2 protein n=1 Tax=Fictibacillus sp. BK138 TaxID=2512121 RepID=UPI001028BFDC|nr:glycosyltransferase [Fictibacillus sp. BK138]RZT21360.1 cellulose synthase/poly-beta-1,6-N-acetylglucosamine synthase-like glycosyltransferase [Fictibacillus sp. BK138]